MMAAEKPKSISWPCHRRNGVPTEGTSQAPSQAPSQTAASNGVYSAPRK